MLGKERSWAANGPREGRSVQRGIKSGLAQLGKEDVRGERSGLGRNGICQGEASSCCRREDK